MKVKGKKIILTGAGSGIGKELTIQLLKKGAYVTGLDINSESLENLKNELNSNNLSTYTVDMSKPDEIIKFTDEYLKNNEADILINNAGIIQPFVNIDKIEDSVINRVMNVNFFGPVKLTRLFLPHLLSRKEGYVVNVSSMGGFFPFTGQSIYGASKAAIKLFTEGLYSELIGTKVNAMIVFPGAINTNISKNSNVEIKNSDNSNYQMLPADKAAKIIIDGIEKNKFQLYVGSDSKIMHFLYKLNPNSAIKMIDKKMKDLK